MSYSMKRSVPKYPTPNMFHAASQEQAQELLFRHMVEEVNKPGYGYTQGEAVKSVVFAEEDEQRYTFTVNIIGD